MVRVAPVYPVRARMKGIEGAVTLRFDIDRQGRVENPRIVRAEPEGVFENAVVAAVTKWRYKPKSVNGKPVRRDNVWVTLQFTLPGLHQDGEDG